MNKITRHPTIKCAWSCGYYSLMFRLNDSPGGKYYLQSTKL